MKNLPNTLTFLRILLIPVFMFLYKTGYIYPAAAVFAAASLTDWADGFIARKYDLVSVLGKFADPLADKLLVSAALFCLVENNIVSAWAAMLIIAREFIVTGLRIVAISSGTVIPAGFWGKVKTVTQLICVLSALIIGGEMITDILIYITIFVTVFSGGLYFYQNRKLFLI